MGCFGRRRKGKRASGETTAAIAAGLNVARGAAGSGRRGRHDLAFGGPRMELAHEFVAARL